MPDLSFEEKLAAGIVPSDEELQTDLERAIALACARSEQFARQQERLRAENPNRLAEELRMEQEFSEEAKRSRSDE